MRSLASLGGSGAVGILLVSYHWQQLPDRVASHFNGSGTADGWMGKDANFLASAGMILGVTAAFYLLGVLMRRLPQRWINLPNKAYWLAAEREDWTRSHLAAWAWTFGAILNVFLLFTFHMAYLANRSDPVALNSTAMSAGLAVYLAVSLGSVVALLVRFGDVR